MKILQLTNKVPLPPRDGGSIASLRLSQGLTMLSHSVTILAMNTKKHFIAPDFMHALAKKQSIEIIAVPVDARIRLIDALMNYLFSRQAYTAKRFLSDSYNQKLKELLQKLDFDLIIVENLYPMIYLKTIGENSRGRVIMRAHNIENEIWHRTAQQARGVKKIYLLNLAKRIKKLETKLINQYDFLAPITRRDEDVFIMMGNKKPSMVLPTGMEIDESPPVINHTKTFSVAHLGALDWSPNQEGIIWFLSNVWPLLRKKYPNAEFHLAGRNAPAWFTRKINVPGLVFHGEVDSANDFITHFPIHIVPLWSGSGMRIKIIEAMAKGRIIVTTPIGIEGIEAVNNETVMIRETAESFASALTDLHANPDKMKEMSKNAYTFVKTHFDNKKLVEDFLVFINDHTNNI